VLKYMHDKDEYFKDIVDWSKFAEDVKKEDLS
jgi:hypothetical protein